MNDFGLMIVLCTWTSNTHHGKNDFFYKECMIAYGAVFHTRNSWCSAIFLSLIVVNVSASSMYALVLALIGSPTIITPCLGED